MNSFSILAGSLLLTKASHISDEATLLLATGNTDLTYIATNPFNSNNSNPNPKHHMRHHVLESTVRNLFVCLHEFNNVSRAQAQMVARARDFYSSPSHSTTTTSTTATATTATASFSNSNAASNVSLFPPNSANSKSSSTLVSSSGEFSSLIVDFVGHVNGTQSLLEKREGAFGLGGLFGFYFICRLILLFFLFSFFTKVNFSDYLFSQFIALLLISLTRQDVSLSTDDLIIVITSLQLGLFACAWLVGDFLTLFELLQGKQLDQLTKSAISPFRRDSNFGGSMFVFVCF
jgi:hypothetical protein